MPGNEPVIITKNEFKNLTKHGSVFAKRNTISIVDHALDEWHTSHNLDNAINLYKACRFFLKKKANKTSSESGWRRSVVTGVLNSALDWIRFSDPNLMKAFDRFEGRKQRGRCRAQKAWPEFMGMKDRHI